MSDSRPGAAGSGDPAHQPKLAAVLFDMDGTLFDSEKLWDISLDDLAASLGGRLSPETRKALVGANLFESVTMVHADLGVTADPQVTGPWLLNRTKELFCEHLPWKEGALELVQAVRDAGIPAALVTSTHRDLTEVALRSFPPDTFGVVVCGDEVTHTKPHPESYLTAAARLGVDPADCVAIEDSPRGIASAEAAGATVVAVPSEVPVAPGPHRVVIDSLVGVTVDWLASLPARSRRPDTAGESRRTPDTAPGGRTTHTTDRD
jgi:HAD superfamily hydrolase (TIGR01509 family)